MNASGNEEVRSISSEEINKEPLKICAICGDLRNEPVKPKCSILKKEKK